MKFTVKSIKYCMICKLYAKHPFVNKMYNKPIHVHVQICLESELLSVY